MQVRSLLEHAWAEIEHEICYKTGIDFPDPLLRRFGALAGALEILDDQFAALRREREELFDSLAERYKYGQDLDAKLDAARLVTLLEANRPEGLGWRHRGTVGGRFTPYSDATCVEALQSAGVRTGRSALKHLNSRVCKRDVAQFAALNSIEPSKVSHFALAVLICGTANSKVLEGYPDLLQDPNLRRIVGL